ncbi:MAG: HAD family hydrolase [Chloroflexota bacterium]|jgi:putative hydrolase of the HAD superfamily
MAGFGREMTIPAIRAVLFDAGDTLIQMPRNPALTLQEVCRQWGLVVSLEDAGRAYRRSERYYSLHYLTYKGDLGEFWRRFHGEALLSLGIDDPTGEQADYLSHVFGKEGVWAAFPEAASVCQQLQTMGMKLAVVSNGPNNTSDLLAQCGLLHYFDLVVASQALGIQKPDPRIFSFALDRLGVSPQEALFVGDLYEVDVVGARAAGIDAVMIDRHGKITQADCPIISSLDRLIPMVKGRRPSAVGNQPGMVDRDGKENG